MSRKASPENAATERMVNAVKDLRAEADEREKRHQKNQQELLQQIIAVVQPATSSDVPPPPVPPPPVSSLPVSVPESAILDAALAGTQTKRKRESQEDVTHFSHWTSVLDALEYAKAELAPQEKAAETAKDFSWRVRKKEGGGEDKSRDKQWRCYRTLAIAVALKMNEGVTETEAIDGLQKQFESFGSQAHTPLLKNLKELQTSLTRAESDALAKGVLNY